MPDSEETQIVIDFPSVELPKSSNLHEMQVAKKSDQDIDS